MTRYTFAAIATIVLISAFAESPVSASGAILVVTAADGPMPKTAGDSKQAHPRPNPSYFVPVESPTMTQARKNGQPAKVSK